MTADMHRLWLSLGDGRVVAYDRPPGPDGRWPAGCRAVGTATRGINGGWLLVVGGGLTRTAWRPRWLAARLLRRLVLTARVAEAVSRSRLPGYRPDLTGWRQP